MENIKSSVFSRLMSILFIVMGVFLGIYAFFANATTWTLPLGSGWNNMTSYIDSTFWNNNPTDDDIITALYGTGDQGSIYTQHWTGYDSGSCINAGMAVTYIPDGSSLPLQLTDNTIYVLTGDFTYLSTGTIEFGNCSAIITTKKNLLLSTGQLTTLLNSSSKNFIIIESIKINGEDNGDGGSHTYNSNGFRAEDSNNVSINNVDFYKNGTDPSIACGIHMNNSHYFHITNTQSFHDRDNGLFMNNSHYNLVESSSFYNNGMDGIFLSGSDYNIFNNIKSYNNSRYSSIRYGLSISNGSNYNSFNNMILSNNFGGISISNSPNNTFNNVLVSNNSSRGISLSNSSSILLNNLIVSNNQYGVWSTSSSGIYYGYTYMVQNNANNYMPTGFSSGSDLSLLGWSTGTVVFGDNIWSLTFNAQNSLTSNFFSWTSTAAGLRGVNNSWEGLYTPIIYSHGALIPTQIQPVIYNNSYSLITGLTFIPTKFIGSDQDYISGSILTHSTNTGTINVYSSISTYYRLFGTGLMIEKTGYINTGVVSLSVTFSGGEGSKPILLQLGSGDNRATHYSTDIIYDLGDPLFTGTTLSGDIVYNGGYYNTGITISFYEPNLSGVTLSGLTNTYFSGAFANGGLINSTGRYQFTIYDTAGNTTGITFTIDTTAPILTGVINGAYYNTGRTITGSDDFGFEGFIINGVDYIGTSYTITNEGARTVTGYDLAGNTATINFTIDKTNPIFTGTTLGSSISGNVINNGYYNTGIRITFYDPNISGATLNGTLYNSGDLINLQSGYTFLVNDLVGNSTGITFTIDTTNPLVAGNYPATGFNITGTNNVTFLRSGSDNTIISGYTLYVTGAEIHTYTTTSTGYTITGLDNGIYIRYIIATDIAGNTGASAMSTFRISTPLNATATLTGGNMIQIGSTRYTRLDATFSLRANQPCRYTITGTYLASFSGDYIGDMILSRSLTGSDGDKVIYITFSTGIETPVTITNTVKLDTTTYAPTLLSPLTGTSVGGTAELRRNHSSIPEAVGRSGYRYYLSYTGTFSSLIASGTVADTITGVNISSGFTSTGTVYRYIEAIDKLGNTSGSAISSFIYDTTADIIPNSFSFNDVTDARLDRVYVSNTLTITGMTTGVNVLASINRGALYISGNFVGTTGYIQNGRTVKIELTSSDEYDEIISSTLTINGISDTFSVTTMEEDEDNGTDYEDIDTNLSNTEKLMIIAVFETLRDLYAGDKEEEFFNTFMLMLEEKMDDFDDNDDEYDALKYLYDLVEQYYEDGDFGDNVSTTPWIVNNIYTAPNGKKYTITYDSSKQRFTSTNFVVPKYFPTLDTLKYIIDINNPVGSKYANAKPILARWKRAAIDGTRQASPYTAPNKKAFYFFKTIDERYSSYTFTSERYFNSLLDVKEFINSTNKK